MNYLKKLFPILILSIFVYCNKNFPVPNNGDYYPMFELAVEYLLDEKGLGKTFLDVKNMYKDMLLTGSFAISFQKFMGISLKYYEDNFFDLIEEFLSKY